MRNIELLFEKNKNEKHVSHVNLNRNILEIEINTQDNIFTGVQIAQIIDIFHNKE